MKKSKNYPETIGNCTNCGKCLKDPNLVCDAVRPKK